MSNLVVNGNFSFDFAGWNPSESVFISTEIYHVAPKSTVLPSVGSVSQTNIPTIVGVTYLLVFYAYVENGSGNIRYVIGESIADIVNIEPTNTWIRIEKQFIATGATDIYFENFFSSNVYIDNVSVTANIICYSGKSIVKCRDKKSGKIIQIRAKDILSQKHEVYSINDKIFVPIIYNIVNGPTDKYMLIEKNSLGINYPTEDFYVTGGHMLVINGKEIKARDIPTAKKIRVKSELVYSICTKKREPISVNNLAVIAWGKEEWHEYAAKKGILWKNNE
ncbi:putative ORFan [Tupanvirus deep ocean]|uniref:ORFan n=2 Tax=Tupanvirus TaxID=2094720 RepID=A0AC62A7L5_9VIRU|nr:putative ORFan [Tupanvirus deep ocean]QKU33709.1 putative ORFan [Tupanvirus deep ocean]